VPVLTARPVDIPVNDQMRLLAGFAMQPVVAAAVGFVSFPAIDLSGRAIGLYAGVPANSLDAAISIAAGAAMVAFVITLVVAVPAVIVGVRRGMLTRNRVLLAGMILGNLPLALIAVLATANGDLASGVGLGAAIRAFITGSLFGLAGASVFWAIAKSACGPPRSSSPH
jgi:hypothetical protein